MAMATGAWVASTLLLVSMWVTQSVGQHELSVSVGFTMMAAISVAAVTHVRHGQQRLAALAKALHEIDADPRGVDLRSVN